MAGLFDGQRLTLAEVYRFENGPVAAAGHLYWDVLGLWQHVLRACGRGSQYGGRIASVGVDTWGVDFGLLAARRRAAGQPVSLPRPAHRRHAGAAFAMVPREEIFAQTGLQFMQFNTLYQLLAMRLAGSPLLECAESLLMMPDLFHWLLTGAEGQRIDQRHDDAILRSDDAALGPATCSTSLGSAGGSVGNVCRPARGSGRCCRRCAEAPGWRRRGGVARHARHGQRRGGRARRTRRRPSGPTGATSARAPGR